MDEECELNSELAKKRKVLAEKKQELQDLLDEEADDKTFENKLLEDTLKICSIVEAAELRRQHAEQIKIKKEKIKELKSEVKKLELDIDKCMEKLNRFNGTATVKNPTPKPVLATYAPKPAHDRHRTAKMARRYFKPMLRNRQTKLNKFLQMRTFRSYIKKRMGRDAIGRTGISAFVTGNDIEDLEMDKSKVEANFVRDIKTEKVTMHCLYFMEHIKNEFGMPMEITLGGTNDSLETFLPKRFKNELLEFRRRRISPPVMRFVKGKGWRINFNKETKRRLEQGYFHNMSQLEQRRIYNQAKHMCSLYEDYYGNTHEYMDDDVESDDEKDDK